MRYHHARFVLAACLAATAAAQATTHQPGTTAPGPSTLGLGLERFRLEGLGLEGLGLEGRRLESAEPSARLAPSNGRVGGAGDTQSPQDPQGRPDYTLTSMFYEAHGDFMNSRERFDPQIELGVSAWPNQRIRHESGSFDWLGYDLDIDTHVLIAPDGYITMGAYYKGRTYNFSGVAEGTGPNTGGMDDESLTATGVRIGFGVFLDDNVHLEVESMPGIWSDMDGTLHTEDMDYPSHALVTFRTLDKLYLKVGVRYNQIYEEAPWLPYLGFGWEFAEGWRWDLLAPDSMEFSFWPTQSFGILLGTEVEGAEYHVRPSLAVSGGNPDVRSDLRVQEWTAYAGIISRMNDNFSFMARGGIVLNGYYELTTGAAGFDPAEGELDQAAFAEISFGFSW